MLDRSTLGPLHDQLTVGCILSQLAGKPVYVCRHDHLAQISLRRRPDERRGNRCSQLGIKMLQRFVQPDEWNPIGSAKDKQPRDQQRPDLLATAET